MLGLAVTGLLAAFMAGVAANVTAFNTVVTYDIIQAYIAKDRDPAFYLRTGRWVTVVGVLVSVATAFIAKGYSNIMNYIQTLFSIFNAPLFATFIIAMFWKRASPWGGFWSLIAGTAAAYATNRLAAYHTIFHFGSATLDGELLAGDHRVRRRCGGDGRGLAGDPAETDEPSSTGSCGAWPRATTRPTSTRATSCGGVRRGCSAGSSWPVSSP